MSRLQDWMMHRARIGGLDWPAGIAEAAGIARSHFASIADAGSLQHVNRAARAYIARALKVSIRELEALSDGRIDWIADERKVEFDRPVPMVAHGDAIVVPQAYICAPGAGVPILGRILHNAKVERFDDWTPDDGPRLPVRFPGLPDAFALELLVDLAAHFAGESLVFHAIPPGEICDGEFVLLTHGGLEGESEIGRAARTGGSNSLTLTTPAGARNEKIIALADIPRAARLVGSSKRQVAME